MITKAELASMIAALESQPHLSIKEEKYLKVCKHLDSLMHCYHQWVNATVSDDGVNQYCNLCDCRRKVLK